ncbi:MAG: hypothetical protein HZB09_00860 [Candidatus Yonathbacteria bacterium]|nr:hypothetical protein [Candidatus Yonathbacteria bacterium]
MNKTKQLLIIVLVINITLVGVYGFLFYSIKAKSEEASTLSHDLNARHASEESFSLLRHAVNDTKDDRVKLQSYFVRSSTINTFFDTLESLGKESNTDMKLSSPIEQRNILAINVSTRGTFENIYYLVRLIEQLPYRIEFKKAYFNSLGTIDMPSLPEGKSVNISKNKVRSVTWEASFTLEISGYSKE